MEGGLARWCGAVARTAQRRLPGLVAGRHRVGDAPPARRRGQSRTHNTHAIGTHGGAPDDHFARPSLPRGDNDRCGYRSRGSRARGGAGDRRGLPRHNPQESRCGVRSMAGTRGVQPPRLVRARTCPRPPCCAGRHRHCLVERLGRRPDQQVKARQATDVRPRQARPPAGPTRRARRLNFTKYASEPKEGPPWRGGLQSSGGVARSHQPAQRVVAARTTRVVQERCLSRQLSLPVSTMSQWWVSRSSKAVVILGSPNTVGHSPNARLVVMITEVRS